MKLYNETASVFVECLVVCYKLDRGVGITISDFAGNNDRTKIRATWVEV